MTSISPRVTRAFHGIVTASVIALAASAARADEPPAAPSAAPPVAGLQRPWLAQPAAPAAAPPSEPARFPWRASLMIAVSAALGGAAVWVRSRKGGLAKLTSSRELRVISSVRVGPKGHLVLAGIGDRAILLGVTDQSVRRIAWMPAEQIVNPADTGVANVAQGSGADIAYTPPSSATSYDPPRRAERASTAIIQARGSAESGLAPALRGAASGRTESKGGGGFAEILRKIGGRNVDSPPAEVDQDLSPAAALAELRKDSVQWSRGATNAVKSSPVPTNAGTGAAPGATPDDGTVSELEQQAAGILKRRSRGKRP